MEPANEHETQTAMPTGWLDFSTWVHNLLPARTYSYNLANCLEITTSVGCISPIYIVNTYSTSI